MPQFDPAKPFESVDPTKSKHPTQFDPTMSFKSSDPLKSYSGPLVSTKPEPNVLEEQGVDPTTRFLLRNLVEENPKLQADYLKSKGMNAVVAPDGRVAIQDSSGTLRPMNPTRFDWQDVTDHFADIVKAGVTGAASTAGAAAGGLPGAMAGGAAAGHTLSEMQQTLAAALGLTKSETTADVQTMEDKAAGEAIGGAAAGAVGQGISKGLSTLQGAGAQAGERAAISKLGIPKGEVERVGASNIPAMYKPEAQELRSVASSDIVAKLTPKLENMQQDIQANLGSIENVSVKPDVFIRNLVSDVSTQSKGITNARQLVRDLKDVISGRRDPNAPLSMNELWDISRKLQNTGIENTRPDLLQAADSIRRALPGLAREVKDTGLADKLQTYYKLDLIRNEAEKRAADPSDLGLGSIPHSKMGLIRAGVSAVSKSKGAILEQAGKGAAVIQSVGQATGGAVSPTSAVQLLEPQASE